MAGQRKASNVPMPFEPGVISNLTDRDAIQRYKSSNRVRWHKGLAEKLGGWIRQVLVGANGGVYIGVARALHDWSSLDTQQWISIGTNCKLYLVNNGRLSDVTPMRLALNLTNALSVQAGSNVITVTAPDHRSNIGDHISLTATATVGGFIVSGLYDIESIPTPDTFTVNFSQNFNNTEVGGGSITIEFDIRCGLPENGERRGYGTGLFGMGTYGTPRPVGSGVPARMRTWSLQNWGEDLLAVPSDGELYWWDRTSGANSRAVLIEEAPVAIQRMLVNPQNRHVILLGCTGLDGVPDPMRIRWCEQENFRIWIASVTNVTAGGCRLDYGSRIVTGIQSRSTNYVWTDTMMYSLQYVGTPDVFLPTQLGTMKIVGPNAMCDVNGIAYSMAFDDFMIYDGTLRVMLCEIHTLIFGDEARNIEGNFDRTQAEAVYCSPYNAKNEVTWWYPGTDGAIHYVSYNTVLDRWYGGTMERTAYHDVSEAITGYKTNPYGVNGGYLYKHEVGVDEVEGETSNPQNWWLETYDINTGGSDGIFLVNFLIPNFDRMSGGMRIWLKKKTYPRQPTYQLRGPYLCLSDTLQLSVRCKASQMAIRFESRGQLGEDWRMGVWQQNATPYGGRMGIHLEPEPVDPTPPGPPVLSGELVNDFDDVFNASLSWTEGEEGTYPITLYRLYRSINGAAYTLLTVTSAEDPRVYIDTDVQEELPYSYRVYAVDEQGTQSDSSNIVTLQLIIDVPPVLEILTELDPDILNPTWIAAVFGNGETVVSYEIYRINSFYLDGGSPSFNDNPDYPELVFLTSVSGATLTYQDTGANDPANYQNYQYAYYVKAIGSLGGELLSNIAITPAPS